MSGEIDYSDKVLELLEQKAQLTKKREEQDQQIYELYHDQKKLHGMRMFLWRLRSEIQDMQSEESKKNLMIKIIKDLGCSIKQVNQVLPYYQECESLGTSPKIERAREILKGCI